MSSSALWRVQLFGVLQLQSSEQTITRFRTQMTGSLLAYLAYYKGRPQPREILIDQFWPDADTKLGRGRLSVALSSLRSQLATPGTEAEVLLADSFTVTLNPALFDTDVAAFQNTLKRARRAPDSFERRALLEEALGHYGGDLLAGRYDSWILPEQERLREQFQQATDELLSLRGISPTLTFPSVASATVPEPVAVASGTYTCLLATGNAEGLTALHTSVPAENPVLFSAADTTCFVFADVHVALSAAVAATRSPRSEARIALDTVYIDATNKRDTSPALRILTGLLRVGHPGQILCSDATATLAWRRSPSPSVRSSYRLRDLGRFQLSDGASAERLFQVEASDDPPLLFPPPQAKHGDAPQLPATYTRFFGRQAELTQLARILTASVFASALITLTGIGGIGKTRLAREVATRVQPVFQDRVWFTPLADILDAERIPDAIREALRLPKDPTLDPLDQCVAFLATAPTLLILDNLEQLVAEGRAAAIVQTLRERVPSLTCLITSRQLLGVSGERAFPVGPLMLSETPLTADFPRHETGSDIEACIMLFEDRARAVRPDFRVTDASYPVIRELCAMLDGIPLAIELAAARVGLLSPAQIRAQMETRFALLRSRKRDVPERHRSLWAAIDSSYQLLPEELKCVFARLSVFRGGWTPASVQAVCFDSAFAHSEEGVYLVLEAIAELQESSLIFASESEWETPRFQMLDTLRIYAAEQLSKQGDEDRTRRRHAAFFTRLAADAEPHLTAGATAQQQWLDLLERDYDNLRLAMDAGLPPEQTLRTANALHRFWLIRGHVTEGRQRLLSSLAALPGGGDAAPAEVANAQNALGILACAVGALEEARDHFEQALTLYRRGGEPATIARALNNIGIVATQTGNFAGARHSYEQSLFIYRALGDSLRQSMVLTNLGGVLVYLEDYDAARQVLEECLPIQKAAQDDFSLLRTLQNIAEVALRQGDTAAAAKALYESLAFRRALGDQSAFGDTLATASVILGKWNRLREATVAWAAAGSLRAQTDTVPSPASAKDENIWIDQIRRMLPEAVFAEMQRQGSAMNFDQAITYIETMLGDAPTVH